MSATAPVSATVDAASHRQVVGDVLEEADERLLHASAQMEVSASRQRACADMLLLLRRRTGAHSSCVSHAKRAIARRILLQKDAAGDGRVCLELRVCWLMR
jgi:hypothetical protein